LKQRSLPQSRVDATNIGMYFDKGAIYEKHVVNEPFVQQLQDHPLASYQITIEFL
jgi:hypothetical protein